MKLFHGVVRVLECPFTLYSDPLASIVWAALRAAVPDAVAVVLMDDHLHVITRANSAADMREALRVFASAVRRSRQGADLRWIPIQLPKPIQNMEHARRTIRYVALNPVRAKLVADPLGWLWSTYRDAFGAVASPWVPSERLADAIGLSWMSPRQFLVWLHRYVSSDPSVKVSGSELPKVASASMVPVHSIERIAIAACSALRMGRASLSRSLRARAGFIALAKLCGWRDTRAIASVAAVSVRTARRHLAASVDVPRAFWMCLGDDRLGGTGVRPSGAPRLLRLVDAVPA